MLSEPAGGRETPAAATPERTSGAATPPAAVDHRPSAGSLSAFRCKDPEAAWIADLRDQQRRDADRADGQWLEPFDGDTAAERDQLWHTDWRHGDDW